MQEHIGDFVVTIFKSHSYNEKRNPIFKINLHVSTIAQILKAWQLATEKFNKLIMCSFKKIRKGNSGKLTMYLKLTTI